MAVDTVASLELARQGLAGLLTIARGALSATVDHQLKEKLIGMQQAILDVQAKLGDVQSERLELLDTVGELRTRLRELESQRAGLDAYELVEVEPGRLLYRSRDGAAREHYACPRCYSERRVGLMQAARESDGQTRWKCASCPYFLCTGTATRVDGSARRSTPSGYLGS